MREGRPKRSALKTDPPRHIVAPVLRPSLRYGCESTILLRSHSPQLAAFSKHDAGFLSLLLVGTIYSRACSFDKEVSEYLLRSPRWSDVLKSQPCLDLGPSSRGRQGSYVQGDTFVPILTIAKLDTDCRALARPQRLSEPAPLAPDAQGLRYFNVPLRTEGLDSISRYTFNLGIVVGNPY